MLIIAQHSLLHPELVTTRQVVDSLLASILQHLDVLLELIVGLLQHLSLHLDHLFLVLPLL